MSFKTPFELYQDQVKNEKKDNVVNIASKRPNLPWSEEVLIEKSKEPRQEKASPLLEWWLKLQNDS